LDEEAVLAFVRGSIKSAWALELLVLLRRDPQQGWTRDRLVRELRGSPQLVDEAQASLALAGLAELTETGVRYRPQSAEAAQCVDALVALYGDKPITVLRTIFTSPSDKIRSFADAFLFQKK